MSESCLANATLNTRTDVSNGPDEDDAADDRTSKLRVPTGDTPLAEQTQKPAQPAHRTASRSKGSVYVIPVPPAVSDVEDPPGKKLSKSKRTGNQDDGVECDQSRGQTVWAVDVAGNAALARGVDVIAEALRETILAMDEEKQLVVACDLGAIDVAGNARDGERVRFQREQRN